MTVKARWHQLWLQRARKLKNGVRYKKRPGEWDSDSEEEGALTAWDRQSQHREVQRQKAKATASDATAQVLQRRAHKAAAFVRARHSEMARLNASAAHDKLLLGIKGSDVESEEEDEGLWQRSCRCKACFSRMYPDALNCSTCGRLNTPPSQAMQRTHVYTVHSPSRPRTTGSLYRPGEHYDAMRQQREKGGDSSRPASPAVSPRTPEQGRQGSEQAMRRMLRNLRLGQSLDAPRSSSSDNSSSSSSGSEGVGYRSTTWRSGHLAAGSQSSQARARLGQSAAWPAGLNRPGSWTGPDAGAESPASRRVRSGQVTREVAPFMSALKAHDSARKERSQLSSSQSGGSKRLPWWALV